MGERERESVRQSDGDKKHALESRGVGSSVEDREAFETTDDFFVFVFVFVVFIVFFFPLVWDRENRKEREREREGGSVVDTFEHEGHSASSESDEKTAVVLSIEKQERERYSVGSIRFVERAFG